MYTQLQPVPHILLFCVDKSAVAVGSSNMQHVTDMICIFMFDTI